jgi:hypothetical protein
MLVSYYLLIFKFTWIFVTCKALLSYQELLPYSLIITIFQVNSNFYTKLIVVLLLRVLYHLAFQVQPYSCVLPAPEL